MVSRLRLALVVGTLHSGGAEKQLYYMARALAQSGVDVHIFYREWHPAYGEPLLALGLPLTQFGQEGGTPQRALHLLKHLRQVRPHIVQATHTYTNLYAALTGRALGSLSLGALRSNVAHARDRTGRWTPWLLKLPHGLIVNSQTAVDELVSGGVIARERTHLLLNVIDLPAFDAAAAAPPAPPLPPHDGVTVIFVARLIPVKRVDLFIRALSQARSTVPGLRGVIVGDGPDMATARQFCADLAWPDEALLLLGSRTDIPALLRGADMLVLCSDDEGFPNTPLEAMAAALPVIVTPAGDAARVVADGVTGRVVPFGDVDALAAALVELARSPGQRRSLGAAGRVRVEAHYSAEHLATRLRAVYRAAARQQQHRRALMALSEG